MNSFSSHGKYHRLRVYLSLRQCIELQITGLVEYSGRVPAFVAGSTGSPNADITGTTLKSRSSSSSKLSVFGQHRIELCPHVKCTIIYYFELQVDSSCVGASESATLALSSFMF
jgi:hypothetical protein